MASCDRDKCVLKIVDEYAVDTWLSQSAGSFVLCVMLLHKVATRLIFIYRKMKVD